MSNRTADETEPLLPRPPKDVSDDKPRLTLIFVGLALCVFLSALDETIVATAAVNIVSQLDAFHLYAWVSVAYLVCLNASQPLYGKLSDIFGRRAAMLFSVLVFLIGSAGCAFASNITIFLASRCVAGIGAGGLTGIAFIIIADLFPLEDRPKYQSILMTGHGIAAVAGPLLGGVFTRSLTWRMCFLINLPICVVTLVIIAAFLRLSSTSANISDNLKKVDFGGALTLVLAVVAIMVPTGLGGHFWPWKSVQIISLYVSGALFTLLFICIEHRFAPNPIIPLRLWKNFKLVRAWMTLFFYGQVFFAFLYYLPVWFEIVEASRPDMSGIRLIPLLVGHVLAGLLFAPIKTLMMRLTTAPVKWMSTLGCFILAVATIVRPEFALMAPRVIEVINLFFFGLGAGLALQTSFVSAQASVSPEDLASANSLAVFFENFGGSIGLSVSAAVNRSELTRRFAKIPAGIVTSDKLALILRDPSLVRKAGFLDQTAQNVVIEQFVGSLTLTFRVCAVFAVLAFLSILISRQRI